MYDSVAVANLFLKRAAEHNDALTPMQLLKLVYIAHGMTLGLLGRPLIKDDVEAWRYGPVIPELYRAVRQYKARPVTALLEEKNGDEVGEIEKSIIEQTYDKYGNLSGPALSRLTHQPGSPWSVVYRPTEFGTLIPQDIIEDHYARLIEERRTHS